MPNAVNGLRERLCSGTQKYALLVGNGFNKHQFDYNGRHKPDDCDWGELLKHLVATDKIANFLRQRPDACKKVKRIFELDNIHPSERGRFLFECLEESGFSRVNTIRALKEYLESEFTITKKSEFRQCELLDMIWENGHHILTTNFDANIENYFRELLQEKTKPCRIDALTEKPGQRKGGKRGKEQQDDELSLLSGKTEIFWRMNKFRWENFSGIQNAATWNDLSKDIWHVHGSVLKSSFTSVLFSSEDYFNAISHFRTMRGNILKDNWHGTRTWLKLFLDCPLIIVGIGLDEGELLLRHLLQIRRRYRWLQGNVEECPSYFLYVDSEAEAACRSVLRKAGLPQGPDPCNTYLKLMGFHCLRFDTYQDMYNLQSHSSVAIGRPAGESPEGMCP